MKKLILIIVLLLSACVPSPQRQSIIATVQPGQSIQSRINAASAGDVIRISAGTYNERLTLSKSDITLEAVGKVNVKQIYVTGSNNTVSGSFWIKDPTSDSGLRNTGNNNVFDGLEISNTMQDGVWFWGHDVIFRNLYIHDILDPSAASTNNGDPHTDCFQTWDWSWATYNVTFENNICDHTRTSQSNQIVMLSGSSHDLTFRGNRFIMHDAGYSPLALYGGTGFVIENNYFCNTTNGGSVAVYLSGASDVTLKNNNYAGYSSFVSGSGITSQTGTVKGSLPCVVFADVTPVSSTATRTATRTPTASFTATFTPTPTPSATNTHTATFTDTPSATPTETPTATPSFTASPTITLVPTPAGWSCVFYSDIHFECWKD